MSEEINENEHEEELSNLESQSDALNNDTESVETITKITGMYKEWFLDYASYVILERAVPSLEDGLKPVQRRIMHSMKDLDDGRYNKVASRCDGANWSERIANRHARKLGEYINRRPCSGISVYRGSII